MRVFVFPAEVSEVCKVALYFVWEGLGSESPDKREEQLPPKHMSWQMAKHMSVILGHE